MAEYVLEGSESELAIVCSSGFSGLTYGRLVTVRGEAAKVDNFM